MAAKDDSESVNFELFLRDFQHVINYLGAQRKLMDAHMVDYFTSNHWETLLPLQIREDLESLSQIELASLPTACSDESENFGNIGNNLKKFLTEAKMAQLKNFLWLRDSKEFSSESKVNFISHIMSPKKSYEVEVMSDVVHGMATQFNVSKILDLGSGKGYLSQNLALWYGLNVVGVDSSLSNTQNAAKRNERLLKAWNGLLKKSLGGKLKMPNSRSEEEIMLHNSTCYLDSCTHSLSHSCNSSGNNEDTDRLEWTCYIDNKQDLCFDKVTNNLSDNGQVPPLDSKYKIDHKDCTLAADSQVILSSECYNMNTTHESSSISLKCEQNHHKNALVKNVSRDENPSEKEQSSADLQLPANAAISSCEMSQNVNPNSFLPITGFVDQSFVASGELKRLFDELLLPHGHSPTVSNGLFLVGLHTCGDLVPMALRIFVNEPSVKLICIVGCCYHLVSQQFGSAAAHLSDDPGFPMSQFLKPFKLHVSRNATMVAQQAADRIASESKVPPPSVLFRAILQVILKEKFGLDGRGMHVGKAGSKCKTFKEYVHKCLTKLGLQDRICELSDEEVRLYHERFKSQENRLHAFHQFWPVLPPLDYKTRSRVAFFVAHTKEVSLRAAIAPCIESVFLLDRLCYLHEQGFKSASIVRLFDPVKSPRCYAIIATKE